MVTWVDEEKGWVERRMHELSAERAAAEMDGRERCEMEGSKVECERSEVEGSKVEGSKVEEVSKMEVEGRSPQIKTVGNLRLPLSLTVETAGSRRPGLEEVVSPSSPGADGIVGPRSPGPEGMVSPTEMVSPTDVVSPTIGTSGSRRTEWGPGSEASGAGMVSPETEGSVKQLGGWWKIR